MKLLKLKDFLSKNKKIIYSVNLLIRVLYKNKLGRKFKYDLITQISLTLFKLRYNLPDRLLEDLFKIDHVTISRIILRVSSFLSKINLPKQSDSVFYIVDSITLRIGKEKSDTTFSGYKHHHGIKFQLTINDKNLINHVSQSYPSSYHDKRIFLSSFKKLKQSIDSSLPILGDKAYVGLEDFNVKTPSKRNEYRYKENVNKAKIDNKNLSTKRIKVELVFAYIKTYRILQRANYYKTKKIEIFFKAIANIYNLDKILK